MSRVSVGLRNSAAALLVGAAALTTATPAWAQAVQMSVSQTVVPAGSPVEVTLTGPPGQFFAVAGSTTGSGLTYGGVQLQLGLDAVVLAQRLESAAPSGQTYVSETTYALTKKRFAFAPVEPLTLKEVGSEMGVTKERIRQIESRAMNKLRQAAAEEHIEIPE